MCWRALAREGQGHCRGGDLLDALVRFLIMLSWRGSFAGELGWFEISVQFVFEFLTSFVLLLMQHIR